MKKKKKIADLKLHYRVGSDTIKSETTCPMCGVPCDIGGDDKEGTHYYLPRLQEDNKKKCTKCKNYDNKNRQYTWMCMECKRYYGDLWEKK